MLTPRTASALANLINDMPTLKTQQRRPKATMTKRPAEKPMPELKCCAPLGVALPRLASRPTSA